MRKGDLSTLLNSNFTDDAEIRIAENPKCLMVVEGYMATMINLEKEWETDGELE